MTRGSVLSRSRSSESAVTIRFFVFRCGEIMERDDSGGLGWAGEEALPRSVRRAGYTAYIRRDTRHGNEYKYSRAVTVSREGENWWRHSVHEN